MEPWGGPSPIPALRGARVLVVEDDTSSIPGSSARTPRSRNGPALGVVLDVRETTYRVGTCCAKLRLKSNIGTPSPDE